MEEIDSSAKKINYKFKDLQIYSSTEWLADNKKKYRQVFDRQTTNYIYAELSFYNKLFDKSIWEVNVTLKCFELKRTKRNICNLEFKRKVSKFDNVVYLREGWGNKKGGVFWKKGTYYWEAWIENEKVATKYFYVEDSGLQLGDEQNYVELNSLKLYEGQYDDVNEDDRKYLKTFSSEETRYIYAEIQLKNKLIAQKWHCELFVKFYNAAKELKVSLTKLKNVKQDDDIIKFSAGWGSNSKGSWREGKYSVEVAFMDHLIAIAEFNVAEESEEGLPLVSLPGQVGNQLFFPDYNLNETFDELFAQLNALIGLSEIKQKVMDHANYIKFLQLRKEKGFLEKDRINIHSVFIGNPGTGKTTVAKMMGNLYKKMGLLSKGHVHSVDRVELVGEYIGQTAPKVKQAIEKARGGVLFIDEAYALARTNDDSKDFGREVIEILVKEMSNGKGDIAIIAAGYPKEMKHFLDSNPGLKSRFKHKFEFTDYMPEELAEIAQYAAKDMEVVFTPESKLLLEEKITRAFRDRDKSFGNARFIFDLVEKAKMNLGLRVMGMEDPDEESKNGLETIQIGDVQAIDLEVKLRLPNIPIDNELLNIGLRELNELIGIVQIKKQITEIVEIVRFHKKQGKNVLHNFHFHTVLIGNPGTGKTTVARILCKIYKALGILERGHMIETDRQGLVAGFVGQTAIKTKERIEEALGGVLFIDEAYALSNFGGLQGDYGNEAIQTLLKRMEDDRGEFFVFAAGYPENMEKFLKANPGLNSRFDKVLQFEDYSPQELLEIATQMFITHGYSINKKSGKYLKALLDDLHLKRDKYFGNAREVRKIVLEAIKHQNLRLAKSENISTKDEKIITKEDIEAISLVDERTIYNKRSIGYSSN